MKNRRLVAAFVATFLTLTLSIGCGDKKPNGFPDSLQPCKIIVLKNGTPEPDVAVSCEGRGSWRVVGETDSSGVAELSTAMGDYRKKGVPEGEFTVKLVKIVDVPHTLTPEEQGALSSDAAEEYTKEYLAKVDEARLSLPAVLGSVDTPLTIQVGVGGSNETTFELADYAE